MEDVKKVLTKVKNHVAANKVTYAMTAVAIAAVALQQWNISAFTRFLKEEGIDPDKYFCPEYYYEKQELKTKLIETVLTEHS